MKILLVDDDAFLRDMYATKFKESGHEVAVMEDGMSALGYLEENAPDVVLLDMVMPGLDGVAFLEKATKLQKVSNTKFVVLSNQGEETDKTRASAAGACGYITKAESIPSEVVAQVEAMMK
ncbi:MAG: response regulator [Candidatus Paceibacterota bacterium]